MGSRIVATGRATPRNSVSNHDLSRRMDTSDEWVRTRTGIEHRFVISSGESLVDIALDASRVALSRAGMKPSDLEAIVVGTVSSDYGFPSFACQLQHRLGIDTIPAFDVAAACSGFVYALSVADSSMRAGEWSRVLVVGADALSTMVDWNDRGTAVLFGDGAGAAVMVSEKGQRGVLGSLLRSSGEFWDLLYVRNRGVQTTIDAEVRRVNEDAIRMKGPELFKIAVKSMADVSSKLAERAGVRLEDIALIVPHQANLRIINAVAQRLGLPPEKVFTNVDRYGNTSAASVPIALDEALEAKRIGDNDLVMLNACGGGLTWGANLLRW
ncbi:MAG TPA: beta-ketoacyl-ACP synthase III [Candidatus Binataceae bacterium]|jgi:3-oxoacyl-[acyl-carrier-protein] synthase-3|nr:beta-ketoacyl-ACP synthase III [Candidatus Binataceae bacterium]